MARPKTLEPKYRHHKASGRAYVVLDGKAAYLGNYGTATSRNRYHAVLAEWVARDRVGLPVVTNAAGGPTVTMLLAAYLRHASSYYAKVDGLPVAVNHLRQVMRLMKRLYGATPAAEFGPLKLKAVRKAMLQPRHESDPITGKSVMLVAMGVSDVTRILSAIDGGDAQAASQLLPLVYDELRKLAAQRMAQERSGQTLQATALVHEAYLRLVGTDQGDRWNGRGHFFAAAAEAMRRILVERARRGRRVRHGGGRNRLHLDQLDSVQLRMERGNDSSAEDLLALNDALTQFESEEPAAAAVVKLRCFTGLSVDDTAAALGISTRTTKRHWAYAKAWLYQQLSGPDSASI